MPSWSNSFGGFEASCPRAEQHLSIYACLEESQPEVGIFFENYLSGIYSAKDECGQSNEFINGIFTLLNIMPELAVDKRTIILASISVKK